MTELSVPNYPGSIHIDSIFHYNGEVKQDITNIVSHTDINSDIDITSSFAEFAVMDYNNWMEKLQFGAGDVIVIKTTQNEVQQERRYVIKAINNIINLENGKTFVIRCISALEYASIHTRISKAYKGLASEIARSIVQEFTEEGIAVWENTTQPINIVTPSWSPMETIDWLANNSSSNNTEKMYCFQDSNQFWNYTSLSNLARVYSNNPITYKYFANTSSKNRVPETGKELFNIKGLNFLRAFDIKREIDNGSIKNTFMDIDVNSKSMNITTNSYWDTYSQNALNPTALWKQTELGMSNKIIRAHSSKTGVLPPFTVSNCNSSFGIPRGQQIEILVRGNAFTEIGMVVNVEIPDMTP